jgi:hypothetical protein
MPDLLSDRRAGGQPKTVSDEGDNHAEARMALVGPAFPCVPRRGWVRFVPLA